MMKLANLLKCHMKNLSQLAAEAAVEKNVLMVVVVEEIMLHLEILMVVGLIQKLVKLLFKIQIQENGHLLKHHLMMYGLRLRGVIMHDFLVLLLVKIREQLQLLVNLVQNLELNLMGQWICLASMAVNMPGLILLIVYILRHKPHLF